MPHICNITGCNKRSVVMVNDHGVDTYLCLQHYQDWLVFEIQDFIKDRVDILPM